MAVAKLIVQACKCEHEYQDKRYGKGMRLHNKTKDAARCSVCGTPVRAQTRMYLSPNNHYTLDTTAYDKAFPRRK